MVKAQEVLNKVTEDVVLDIMKEHGSPLYDTTTDGKTNQKCLWFRTICHGGDSHKLCYFTETKDFYCYTCCGRMPFFNFIAEIENLKIEKDFYKILSYVAKKVGISLTSYDRYGIGTREETSKELRMAQSKINRILEARVRNQNNNGKVEINTFYDENILNYFDENTFYKGWIDEGITIPTMQKFGIRWYELEKHVIIPHYNIDGKLVGIRRRSLKPEDVNNKYMPEYLEGKGYDHALSLNLYGLYQNKEAIQKSHKAIIVESEKSVMLSDSYYGDKSICVATCGFNISEWQIMALKKLNVDDIYLCFDKDYDIRFENEYKKDKAVWRNYERYVNRLDSLMEKCYSCGLKPLLVQDKKGLLDLKDAPFDKGKSTLEALLRDTKRMKNQGERCRLL